MCAQGSHASMAFLTKGGLYKRGDTEFGWVEVGKDFQYDHWQEINHWLQNSFRKICVYVNNEEELIEIHQKALDKGLISHIVEDNGATEFNGIKTLTCCAIGPHWDSKFEGITDNLPLL